MPLPLTTTLSAALSAATLASAVLAFGSAPAWAHDESAHGATGELVWQFTHAGTVDFACLLPGHFEAGMVGRIVVR